MQFWIKCTRHGKGDPYHVNISLVGGMRREGSKTILEFVGSNAQTIEDARKRAFGAAPLALDDGTGTRVFPLQSSAAGSGFPGSPLVGNEQYCIKCNAASRDDYGLVVRGNCAGHPLRSQRRRPSARTSRRPKP